MVTYVVIQNQGTVFETLFVRLIFYTRFSLVIFNKILCIPYRVFTKKQFPDLEIFKESI